MALKAIEGFENTDAIGSAVGNSISRKLTSSTLTLATVGPGRIKGKSIKFADTTGTGGSSIVALRFGDYTAQATWIFGFGIRVRGVYSTAWNPIQILDSSTLQCNLRINTDRTISAMRNATVLASSAEKIPYNGWCYIEVKATINNTTGVFTVKLNGTQVINFSGNTRNGTNNQATRIDFRYFGDDAFAVYYDDIYICDSSGGSSNDFLGDSFVEGLSPNGAGNYSQFTPSTGSNWQNVDDNDDDTTYNESQTVNQIDTYTYQDLSYLTSVLGINLTTYAKKLDAAATSAASVLRRSSTDSVGTTTALTTSYTAIQTTRDTDHVSSSAYSVANVNSLEAGIKYIS